MKKDVEAVVSAMGALLAIMVDLVRFIKELGGEVGADIYRLAQPEGQETLRQIAGLIANAGRNVVIVVVDYIQSLAQMIAAGKYDGVNADITVEHFPVQGSGQQKVAVELLHFNRYFPDGDEVLAEIRKQGYRPATIAELLALGAARPELQKQFPIAALGSVWFDRDGDRGVPYLHWDVSRRRLDLCWLGGGWFVYWRFAVVRQVS